MMWSLYELFHINSTKNTELSCYKKLGRFLRRWVSQLILDVDAIFSIFSCQNELTLLYPQVFKDFFIKFKHCFSKFKEFSRRKSFSRSFQGPSSFSRSIPGPCEPCLIRKFVKRPFQWKIWEVLCGFVLWGTFFYVSPFK